MTTDLSTIFILVNDRRVSVAAFQAMDPAKVRTVDATGCTALTELNVSNATHVDAGGCTALTALNAPNATYVYARGCTALTALNAPKATWVNATGCTALSTYAGEDSRGYGFHRVLQQGKWRICAGCRNYSLAGARRHWGPGGPSDRRDCLALVEKLAAGINADLM